MTNAHFTRFDQYRDIETLNHVAIARTVGTGSDEDLLAGIGAMGRDNARTPMQWDDSPHAGFTTGTPWIEVNANYPSVNAAADRADPGSVFHHYRALIALRHDDPVVGLGDFTMLLPEDEHVYAFVRRLGADALLVLGNFSGEPQGFDVGDAWTFDDRSTLVLGNYDGTDVPASELRPWEARVYRRSA